MNEFAGNLSISHMLISYDSTRYQELKKTGKEPSLLLNIYIPEISVSGIKTPRALIENEIVGRKLEIKNPVISIIYTNAGKDSSRALPAKEIYEQILGNLDLIQADTVLISGGSFRLASISLASSILAESAMISSPARACILSFCEQPYPISRLRLPHQHSHKSARYESDSNCCSPSFPVQEFFPCRKHELKSAALVRIRKNTG